MNNQKNPERQKADIFVRMDPERPAIVHLSKTPHGETLCKLNPSSRLIGVATDSKTLTWENVCPNCNGKLAKKVQRIAGGC